MVEVSKCPSRKVNPIPYGGGVYFFRQERYPPANPGRLVGRLAPSQSLTTRSKATTAREGSLIKICPYLTFRGGHLDTSTMKIG